MKRQQQKYNWQKTIKFLIVICFLIGSSTLFQLPVNGEGSINFDLSIIEQNKQESDKQYLSKDFNIPIFTTATTEKLLEYKEQENNQKQLLLDELFKDEHKISGTISSNNDIFQGVPAAGQKEYEVKSTYFDITIIIIPFIITLGIACVGFLMYMLYKMYKQEEENK